MTRASAYWALVAAALRFGVARGLDLRPAWDATLYLRAAEGLARGEGYHCGMFGPAADPSVPTAFYPVGLPAWLALFFALLGAHPWVWQLAGALAGALSVGLTHHLTHTLGSPRRAHLAAALACFAPGAVVWSGAPMTETVWGASLLAMVALGRGPGGPRWRAFGAGTLLAAASYLRPNALALGAVVAAAGDGTRRARAHLAVASTVIALAWIAPWTARNCVSVDGCLLLSANGGSNLAIGALPRGEGTYFQLRPSEGCPLTVVGDAARDACWRRVARRAIARDPAGWLRRMPGKLAHTLEYERFVTSYAEDGAPGRWSPAARAWADRWLFTGAWRALLVLALLGLATGGRPPGVIRQSLAVIAAVLGTHAVFFGGDRYHVPLVPFFAMLASRAFLAIETPWNRGPGAPDGTPRAAPRELSG